MAISALRSWASPPSAQLCTQSHRGPLQIHLLFVSNLWAKTVCAWEPIEKRRILYSEQGLEALQQTAGAESNQKAQEEILNNTTPAPRQKPCECQNVWSCNWMPPDAIPKGQIYGTSGYPQHFLWPSYKLWPYSRLPHAGNLVRDCVQGSKTKIKALIRRAKIFSQPAMALVRLTQTESRHHSCHWAQQCLPLAIILCQGN